MKSALKEQTVEDYDSKTHGALQVMVNNKTPHDSFDVLRDGKRVEGSPKLLNATLELLPGTYSVAVNKTKRNVTIGAGKKTILLTGELKVEGKPSTTAWYAMEGDKILTSSGVEPLLNKEIALFPGSYTVFVDTSLTGKDTSLGKAEVKAGQMTVLKR